MFEVQTYGEGTNLVILHGNPVPPESMALFIDGLKDHFRVIVPNMLASGLNAADQLSKLDQTLAAHDVEEAAFLGHSYGGLQSFHMAARGDVKVTTLVALGPLVYYPQEVLDGYQELATAIEADAIDIAEVLKPTWLTADYLAENPDAGETIERWMDLLSKEDLLNVIRHECDVPDLREDLPRLDLPVYIRTGSLDQATPLAWSQEIHELLPNSILDVVDGVGHFLQMEDPEATLRAVHKFLAK
jgi:pimeloyl-ACP methyl ester carboxylesterase